MMRASRIMMNCGRQALPRTPRDARISYLGQIHPHLRYVLPCNILTLRRNSVPRDAWCGKDEARTTHHAARTATSNLSLRHFERTFA